jgi:aerobic C4-dicarboxylate transport protein
MIRSLYFWVLFFVFTGIVLGVLDPALAARLKFLGDGFVLGIKFLVGPLIFTTVSLGISRANSGKNAARIGLKAFLYFEVVSTFALLLGLLVGNLFQPGQGFPLIRDSLDASLVQAYAGKQGFILNPFESGVNLVQVLVLAVVSGIVILNLPLSAKSRIERSLNRVQLNFFKITSLYMWLAPIGAGAAIAFTVGRFGFSSLRPLLFVMVCFYFTCFAFVFLGLGFILRFLKVPVLPFFNYLKEEILLVLGTSSSESALAPLIRKLENAGCDSKVVGLVVPTGYSFNLDGTNIYLTLAILFIAQAFQVQLGIWEQLAVLLFAMLSSKGASGVTGAGFITLAATLSVVPEVPVVGLTLILGIDRFMSEARAITNMIGNGVGALVISNWEGSLDRVRLNAVLNRGGGAE